jgi:hypothetical protein
MKPPTKKKPNALIMYMIPICFASVVRSTRASAEPLTWRLTGQGRAIIGFGTTVVIASSGGLLKALRRRSNATPIEWDAQPHCVLPRTRAREDRKAERRCGLKPTRMKSAPPLSPAEQC